MSIIFGPNGNINISPEMVRDALLSLSVEERKFVVSEPSEGEAIVTSIAWDNGSQKVAVGKVTE